MNRAFPRIAPQVRSLGTVLCISAMLLAAATVSAQGIYKSVDAQGNVVYSDQASLPGATRVILPDDGHQLPRTLHVCWTSCFTLVGDHGVYRRADGTDETWTVETFTADSFVLERHDPPAGWNGYHDTVTYAGQVADDRLIHVSVNGRQVPAIQMAWGAALDSLPGSNAQRAQFETSGRWTPDGERASAVATGPDAGTDTTVSASVAPPALPDEEQPDCDVPDSLWEPGYWVWTAVKYRWVPGAWVRPPRPHLWWTPAYWNFAGGLYVFHPGHWGTRVGYYGGVNYGHGYGGAGYDGGRWVAGTFAYNAAVSHVSARLMQVTHSTLAPMARPVAQPRVSRHQPEVSQSHTLIRRASRPL